MENVLDKLKQILLDTVEDEDDEEEYDDLTMYEDDDEEYDDYEE